jgi:hypothetical protein
MLFSPKFALLPYLTAAAVLAAACLSGCGKAVDAGTVAVAGTVTLDGKPIDNAAVAFIGKEGARLATAQTNSAGKFTIRAAMGKNVVTVSKTPSTPAPPSDEPQLMPTAGEYQKMAQAAKSDVPAKYGDPKTSGLSIDVSETTKDVEFALSAK